MNNEEYAFAKATDFNNGEKFDIAIEYMKWCAKLQYFKTMTTDNLSHDEFIKRMATIASLTALVQCLSDNDQFIRCATELQLAQESPLWGVDLPELFK